MAFPPSLLDEIRLRISLADLIGRRVKLVRKGREFLGLCPFHNEKTPSFTVNEDKGFFHCFGCGEHGDIITFVEKTEGLNFPEAVKRLAEEAGVAMPEETPEDRMRDQRRATLRDVLDTAAQWFRSQLKGETGREARAYLAGRGLEPAIIDRFGLGFAPNRRTGLKDALLARGLDEALLVEAGLLVTPEDGGANFDRFRHRIMFPIWDARGQVIAFGGRALGEARAKYLNSPETPVFHKGHVLYGLHLAKDKARDSGTLIVAEGYMDVIAMAAAGFENAVAPLGTALTETQMRLMWRVVPEPVLCLDGDAAGWRAGQRAAERCLTEIKPGLSLKFARLPAGQDPDDLIRDQGAAALEDCLSAALPLSELLWQSKTEGQQFATPERRAALQQKLREVADQITDSTVKSYYRQYFADRMRDSFGSRASEGRFGGRPGGRPGGHQGGRPGGRRSYFGPASGHALNQSFNHGEQVLLAGVLNHPEILTTELEVFAAIAFSSQELDSLKDAILEVSAQVPDLDSSTLKGHLADRGLSREVERLVGRDSRLRDKFIQPDVHPGDALAGWKRVLARHQRDDLRLELKSAELEYGKNPNQVTWERLQKMRSMMLQIETQDAMDMDGRNYSA